MRKNDFPVVASQHRIIPSPAPAHTAVLSGDHATLSTRPSLRATARRYVRPSEVLSSTSNIRTEPSSQPAAREVPFGLRARSHTAPPYDSMEDLRKKREGGGRKEERTGGLLEYTLVVGRGEGIYSFRLLSLAPRALSLVQYISRCINSAATRSTAHDSTPRDRVRLVYATRSPYTHTFTHPHHSHTLHHAKTQHTHNTHQHTRPLSLSLSVPAPQNQRTYATRRPTRSSSKISPPRPAP